MQTLELSVRARANQAVVAIDKNEKIKRIFHLAWIFKLTFIYNNFIRHQNPL